MSLPSIVYNSSLRPLVQGFVTNRDDRLGAHGNTSDGDDLGLDRRKHGVRLIILDIQSFGALACFRKKGVRAFPTASCPLSTRQLRKRSRGGVPKDLSTSCRR